MGDSNRSRYDHRSVHERKYRRPPVIEALCEIYFSGSVWDETVPGAFYERMKQDFPQKQQRRFQAVQVSLGPEEVMAGVHQLPPWMQFISGEKHRMVQIAQDVLVVNQLAPYPHFEEWELDIYRAMREYNELARPQGFSRIGVRYINHVEIPGPQVRLADLFTIYPNLPPALGDAYGAFMVRVEVPKGDHTVLITFGTAPPSGPPEAVQAYALDFYDIIQLESPVDTKVVKKLVEQAHENIVEAFEASITNRLRDLFELEGGQ